MSFNNAVRDGWNGHWSNGIIGYRCYECDGIFQQMWGTTCNECRAKERRHQELVEAIKNRPVDSSPPVAESLNPRRDGKERG